MLCLGCFTLWMPREKSISVPSDMGLGSKTAEKLLSKARTKHR